MSNKIQFPSPPIIPQLGHAYWVVPATLSVLRADREELTEDDLQIALFTKCWKDEWMFFGSDESAESWTYLPIKECVYE